MMDDDPLPAIKQAAQGLTYPSESDEPFDAFQWPNAHEASIEALIASHGGAGRKIARVSVDDFFGRLADSEDVQRFDHLRAVLEGQLSGLAVYRAGEGEVQVDIYLIGRARNGNLAGLHTVSVET